MKSRHLALLAAAALVGGVTVSVATASTPASSTLTAPTAAGTRSVSWTGTIPVGSNPQNACTVPGTDDQHALSIRVPAAAAALKLSLSVKIAWTPPVTETVSDEVLTLLAPDGSDVGDSDGGSTTEQVVINAPVAGTYTAVACGFANTTPQAYKGTATLTATVPVKLAALPTVNRGLAFGASTPSDVQRDIGEPAVTTDRAGNIYTCGPSGFSNIADYANVSTDGGDQFHLLGQPPRGQISGGEGGGDCALATAVKKNAQGNYALAYAGLGPLTNFSTATSGDVGRTIQVSPVSESVPGVDRQWIAFLDDKTAFFTYNQQALNKVVQKSTDAGLTYDTPGVQAADEAGRIGQIRAFTPPGKSTASQGVVYFPYSSGSKVKLAVSRDSGKSFTTCVLTDAGVSPDAGFVGADNDDAGNIYGVYAESGGDRSTYLVVLPVSKFSTCTGGKQAATNPKVRINREGVNTVVMPWVAASGVPGRVAIAYYGTESVGDPNQGAFKATWNVYVSQSTDALSAQPHFDQVKATTHPFHYDSICLNGLGCDLSVPAGDRSLVDYFTMEYNRKSGKLNIVYSNAAKRPGDASGYVSQPTVLVQSGGPSNGGGTVKSTRPVLARGSTDPAGDALSQYSSVLTRTMPSVNSKALDLRSVSVVPTRTAFKVTLKVSDLSSTALQQALSDNTPAIGLVWIFRWVNGYQPAAVSLHWSPASGFSGGFDGYATDRTAGGTIEKYAGATPLGDNLTVDQAKGTITFRVPSSYLHSLQGPQGPGQRPQLEKAVPGARFYDGYAASFADVTTSTAVNGTTSTESYLYPADNAPTFDFALLGRTAAPVKSRATTPVTKPSTPTTSGPGGLAATGLETFVPWLAVGLLAFGLASRRLRAS
ncbi:MAG: hypothetical protein JWO27_1629 [Frankiales bacterium]|nr:hypothetical protein [Frankiales bacterium]